MFCMEQENYIKPEVEIYEVEVEQGFQASGTPQQDESPWDDM